MILEYCLDKAVMRLGGRSSISHRTPRGHERETCLGTLEKAAESWAEWGKVGWMLSFLVEVERGYVFTFRLTKPMLTFRWMLMEVVF